MKKYPVLAGLLPLGIALGLASCRSGSDPNPVSFPTVATTTSPGIMTTLSGGVNVYKGGFGAAVAPDPNDAASFFMLTNRGPNVDGSGSTSKIVLLPQFTPQIGKFRLSGDSLSLIQTINLKDATGKNLTGLPNAATAGTIAETTLDSQGKTLATDPTGLDGGGLVALKDGTFWVSEGYGPSLVHFDASGKTLERINPFGTGKALPKVLARRRTNRSMQGLTMTPDEKTLVGLMQSPLSNPNQNAVSASRNLRIVTMDIATGATKQYVYLLDTKDLRTSEIAALTKDTFLVIERDETKLANGVSPVKLIYKISLGDATDVSELANSDAGRLVNGKTIDFATPEDLQANGIKTAQKTLIVDILQTIPTYPHDKVDGLAVISPTMIAISNQDDFGITSGSTGAIIAKILPFTSKVDRNTLYFIRLSTPLK